MLRFRPIAPKPVGGGSDSKNVLVNNKRSKKKYVRVGKYNNGYRRQKKTTTQVDVTGSEDGMDKKIVTLQLLPERADSEDRTRRTSRCNYVDDKTRELEKPATTWLNLKNDQAVFDNCMVGLGVTTSSDQTVAVVTLVTVESVSSTADTSTCSNNMDFRGIGSTGRLEMMMKLERDTCPAFVSDDLNRVQWVNGAYKRMVMVMVRLLEKQEQSSAAETVTVLVSLVMKDKELKLPSSFTCKVRVEYRWQKEKEMMKYSKMVVVPCDVWRIMEIGGFAWRLYVESALSLGR
ncbi:hypothetical protein Dsin_031033 [Dipteronia sinensis]|uniref:DUF7950 domain-containing protein n=1 Tax=Dipteronia sinensis TaxID=43782 RepID=A0AAD9ZKI0_9ROSI|nr:hypothetical protein Dsin_031033 [Dipteronia sinensis]